LKALHRHSESFDMSRIPLTLQMYSLREACAVDFAGTLKAVAELGYEGVEFAGYFNYSAADLRKILDDLGLVCSGTHTGLQTVLGDELAKTAEFNLTLGTPYLIVPWVSPEQFGGHDGAKRLGEVLSSASDEAAKLGARVGYHNHDWEFQALPDGAIPMDLIFENASPDVILQADTGNAQHGGGDAVPIIEKYKSRAATVHLKPYTDDFSRYFLGEDDIDWANVFAACESGATKYYIVEQERYPEPYTPLECVARCLSNLKKMGK